MVISVFLVQTFVRSFLCGPLCLGSPTMPAVSGPGLLDHPLQRVTPVLCQAGRWPWFYSRGLGRGSGVWWRLTDFEPGSCPRSSWHPGLQGSLGFPERFQCPSSGWFLSAWLAVSIQCCSKSAATRSSAFQLLEFCWHFSSAIITSPLPLTPVDLCLVYVFPIILVGLWKGVEITLYLLNGPCFSRSPFTRV